MTLITSRDQLLTDLKPGARLRLADGFYGVLRLVRIHDVVIEGGPGAVVSGVEMSQAQDITLKGFGLDWPATDAKATAVRVAASQRVTLEGLTLRGGLVAPGTLGALSADQVPPPPMNSFLVGCYAGRAVAIEFSEAVAVIGCDISGFFSGVSVGKSSRVRIERNHIHRLRTTPIKGGGSDITIRANRLEHMTPYRFLNAATGKMDGDHFDFIHMYSGRGAAYGLAVWWALL